MRIVTYNTRGSLGMDNKRSTPRIAQTVRALAPDIVCFQEIHRKLRRSGQEDQPVELERLLARPFVFHQILTFGFGGYGVGISVRGTVAEHKEHLLPSKKEQRGALEVQVRNVSGFHALTVFCTHWGLDAQERVEQAGELARLVNAVSHPVIVCGDFNENAEGQGVRRLLSETGLLDADAARNRLTFVADNPKERIDFILYSPDLMAKNVEVVSSLASDHLPVLADIELV